MVGKRVVGKRGASHDDDDDDDDDDDASKQTAGNWRFESSGLHIQPSVPNSSEHFFLHISCGIVHSFIFEHFHIFTFLIASMLPIPQLRDVCIIFFFTHICHRNICLKDICHYIFPIAKDNFISHFLIFSWFLIKFLEFVHFSAIIPFVPQSSFLSIVCQEGNLL